jgi:hypothetical protein
VAFPQILADGVIAARHFAQYKVSRGQVPFTPASYAPNPAVASAAMQRLWYERARLVMALPSAVPPLVIAPFTDMQRFPAFNSIVAAACATVRRPGNGVFFTYLSRTIGTVTPAILNAPTTTPTRIWSRLPYIRGLATKKTIGSSSEPSLLQWPTAGWDLLSILTEMPRMAAVPTWHSSGPVMTPAKLRLAL